MSRLEGMDVGTFRHVLREGRRTLVACVAISTVLGLALNAIVPPVYRATVRIEIRRPPERSPLTGEPLTASSFQSENVAMYTAAELITNRVILGAIAADLTHDGWIT